MFLTILKSIGFKQQGLLILEPEKFILIDIKTSSKNEQTRISKHPRSIVGGFVEVETELKSLVRKVFPSKLKFTQIIICLNGLDDGGYTAIELRACRELVYGVGAHEVHVAKQLLSSFEAKEVFSGNGEKYINSNA